MLIQCWQITIPVSFEVMPQDAVRSQKGQIITAVSGKSSGPVEKKL